MSGWSVWKTSQHGPAWRMMMKKAAKLILHCSLRKAGTFLLQGKQPARSPASLPLRTPLLSCDQEAPALLFCLSCVSELLMIPYVPSLTVLSPLQAAENYAFWPWEATSLFLHLLATHGCWSPNLFSANCQPNWNFDSSLQRCLKIRICQNWQGRWKVHNLIGSLKSTRLNKELWKISLC